MTDWRTIRQDLVEETRAASDDRMIDRCLVQALRWHRTIHTFFNEKVSEILTVVDQDQYDLPDDFVQRVGKVHFRHSTSTTQIPMESRSWDWMKGYRNRFGADEFSNEIHGFPRIYAIKTADSYDGVSEIYVGPTPSVANDVIIVRYVADLGTPNASFSPEYGWRIVGSDGNPISTTFTQRWLQDGYECIRAYAKWLYNQKFARSDDEAQRAQVEWQSQLAEIRRRTSRSRRPDSVRFHLKG